MTAGIGAKNYDDAYFKKQQQQSHKIVDQQYGFLMTHRLYLRKLLKYQTGGRLLDFGCGKGYFLKVAEGHFKTYGIDISEYCVNETRSNSPASEIICGDEKELQQFNNGFFNVITAIDVLEHISRPDKVIEMFHSKLTTDGILLINIPNTGSLGKQWKGESWFAYRDKSHISVLPKDKWLKMLKASGFSVIDVIYDGLWDTPYIPRIPLAIQNISIKIPMILLINLVNLPEKLGENVCMISKKK